MGELTEARLHAVRTLLQRAPDFAVQSLSCLLASDQSDDRSLELVRQLVSAEAEDRRLRTAVLEPLAVLCKASPTIPHLTFPAATPALLWRALKSYRPGVITALEAAARTAPDLRDVWTPMDKVCAAAAEGLDSRATADFASLADLLDHSRKGCARVVSLLNMMPELRESVAKAASWLSSFSPANVAGARVTFRNAAEKSPEAGFLYMEVVFAAIEQPAFILRLIAMIMDRPSDRFLAASELGTLGERLLDAVDRHVAAIQEFRPQRGLEGGVAAAAAATAATLIIAEFEANLAMSRESVWGARILRQRQSLTLAMEMRIREVDAALSAALPVKMMRVNGKQLRGAPDLSKPPNGPAVDKVMALVALLSGCGPAAQVTGFSALRAKVVDAQDQALDTYVQDVLDLLHRGQAPVEIARAYLDVAAELVGLVRDPRAADLVRRRAVAATASAA